MAKLSTLWAALITHGRDGLSERLVFRSTIAWQFEESGRFLSRVSGKLCRGVFAFAFLEGTPSRVSAFPCRVLLLCLCRSLRSRRLLEETGPLPLFGALSLCCLCQRTGVHPRPPPRPAPLGPQEN